MDFLRSQFNEELDAEGDVSILFSTFQRHEILSGLEKETYNGAFEDWLEQRRQRMLERASETVSKHRQGARFDKLRSAFWGGNLVPFVGAGVSIPSGYPGWTESLWEIQAKSFVPAEALQAMLDTGDYEGAAQMLHDDLGAGAFDEWLQNTYERRSGVEGVVHYLPTMFHGHVVTTNFDNVLERAFMGSDQGFDRTVLGRGLGEAPRLAADGARLLIKIHGTCEQVADRVLLTSEYEAAYADRGNVQQFFQGFLFGRSLLFLGCNLSIDRTLKEMQRVVAATGASKLPRHYAIVELKDTDDSVARERELAKANVFPIWYQEGQHDCIEAFLLAISEKS